MSTTTDNLNQQFQRIFGTDEACIREHENHIGYCAACGRIDHHLINEMCPTCKNKYSTTEAAK
jgi:hypothetical protein